MHNSLLNNSHSISSINNPYATLNRKHIFTVEGVGEYADMSRSGASLGLTGSGVGLKGSQGDRFMSTYPQEQQSGKN